MSNDPHPDRPPSPAPESADESLNEALTGLERILGERGPEEPRDAAEPAPPEDDAQYAIPLLDEVVVPGAGGEITDELVPVIEELHSSDAEIRQRIVARLASEIEVIVHTRVEKALRDAARDLRAQLRNHVEIMLPEIIDEISRISPPEEDE